MADIGSGFRRSRSHANSNIPDAASTSCTQQGQRGHRDEWRANLEQTTTQTLALWIQHYQKRLLLDRVFTDAKVPELIIHLTVELSVQARHSGFKQFQATSSSFGLYPVLDLSLVGAHREGPGQRATSPKQPLFLFHACTGCSQLLLFDFNSNPKLYLVIYLYLYWPD